MAAGWQFGLVSILQSSVTFNLKVNSPKTSFGFGGKGSVPIFHITEPFAPCEGSKDTAFGVGAGLNSIVPFALPAT